jgi:hypothetical protein
VDKVSRKEREVNEQKQELLKHEHELNELEIVLKKEKEKLVTEEKKFRITLKE